MICAWIDTSRAEIGSSQTMKLGLDGQRAGDADALALAAGELVRVAVGEVGVEADQLAAAPARAPASPCPCARLWISSGSPMMLPTVMRGLSEAYGSWKIICILRRILRSSLAARARSGPARRS